ncbi:hypothetical protein [Hymenobacter elongatus]|uniref:DUF2490 domain-containing protein n=1 Tax=Hymenobacter elongatus TaxID=877208 RepID=A0A4Z0PSM6_9BACT|nr:hypothetical protein [Hymenobacter elongatus]TGE19853.1 hypothetical protein E5J99_01780 [Hymenobacter elongatus]
MNYIASFGAAVLIVLSFSAQAQRNSVNNTLLLPELQAEVALHDDDYLLVSVQGPTRIGGFDGTQLDRLGLQLAYEKFWSERWSGGATLRGAAYGVYRGGSDVQRLYVDGTPELFVRHWNTWGKFNFRQRLGLEYTFLSDPLAEGRAVTRLRLDLDRVFAVGKLALRPRLAYEAFTYLRFQREETEPKERIIDFGALRADLGIRVSPHLDLTPWVASNTAYRFVLEQTDVDGNVVVPGGKFNSITPVVGLDIRFTIFRGPGVFERRQLPTQH